MEREMDMVSISMQVEPFTKENGKITKRYTMSLFLT